MVEYISFVFGSSMLNAFSHFLVTSMDEQVGLALQIGPRLTLTKKSLEVRARLGLSDSFFCSVVAVHDWQEVK
jgi:hypothetical protein